MDQLIERAHRGEASAAELERLDAWRNATDANERHYTDVVRILDAAATLRAEITAAVPPAANDLIGGQGPAAGGGLSPHRNHTPARARPGWGRRMPWSIAAAAVLLLLANVLFTVTGGQSPLQGSEVVTGDGEIATVQLGEGSVVRLAPNSRLRLGEDGDPRIVTLDGRAFFSVAEMPDHPFVVRTYAATATVLGTRFEIGTIGDDLRLIVVEGRVALETAENRVEVAAGEMSAVADRFAATPTPVNGADAVPDWTGRFLAFQSTPLGDAVREIAAVYDVRIDLTDPTLSRQTVTAVFTGQDVDAVLEVMCEIVNARCVVRGSEVIITPR